MEDVQPMEESVIYLQEESDTESLSSFCSSSSSCMTSMTDLSIYHEFDCMIAELHAIQESQQHTIDRLHSLQGTLLVIENEPIEEEDETDELAEFREMIQQFHTEALYEIESSLPSTFTEKLLQWIDSSERESEDESE